ncbi:MAG TPA: hypothetical protein VG013_26045 [Gemmataceae bacterium]|jgi:hypothetical protein|nr:hypothetical protein [Gemmataceae bacterium]
MSISESTTGKQTKLYVVLAIAAVIAVAIALMSLRPKTPSVARSPGEHDPDDSLATARETLYQGADFASCRNAVQSLNLHLSHHAEDRPSPLTGKEQDALAALLDLDAGELTEVNTGTFTSLDAHYLDLCFLMRDAARSLDVGGLKPVEQAVAAFHWVVRQVRLRERDEEPAPPAFVLRRGWGTALERAFVFLAVLKQLGIDGCMITCPREGTDSPAGAWVPGALVGGDILLFDTRLGLPLPGPHGRGVATLAQAGSQPDVLNQLTVNPKHPYDVTPKQAARAEARLVCSLSGLAPRMKYLEGMLASSNQVSLTDDPGRMLDRFRLATGKRSEFRFWDRRGEPVSPVRLLRRFFTSDDGGIDHSQRKRRLERELFPVEFLPEQVRALPDNVPPGQWLEAYFAELFEDFPITAPLVAAEVNQQIGSDQMFLDFSIPPQELAEDFSKRFGYFFLTGAALRAHSRHFYTHFLLAPKTPRDHILRGRFGEAATQLVEALDQARFQQEQAKRVPNLDQEVAAWAERAQDAQLALQRAQAGAAKGKASDDEAISKAQARMLAVWPILPAQQLRGAQGAFQLPPWLVLLLDATAQPINSDATYLLALCKHEEAEREQVALAAARRPTPADRARVREAWERAAHWWKIHLDEHATAPGATAARRLRAEALAAMGQSAEAADLLEDLSDDPPALEKTARLYRARQLRDGQTAGRAKPGAGKHR